jgi:hypothetical protein
MNDNNIISFWCEYPYNNIIQNLKKFYKYDGVKIFDDNFLEKYNIKDEDLIKILI